MPHEILFSLVFRYWTSKNQKKENFEEKVREIEWCFNIYIVVFTFQS